MRAARLTAPLVLAVSSALFVALALDLALGGPMSSFDRVASDWFRDHAGEHLLRAMGTVSALHEPRAILAATVALVLLLLWRRDGRGALLVLAAVPGGAALNWALKQAFERPRPDAGEGGLWSSDFAFPSGHAANSTLLYGTLVLLALRRARGGALRWGIVVAAAAMVALVAFSRVALRAHYPGDVLAAIAEGVAWLALCALATGEAKRR